MGGDGERSHIAQQQGMAIGRGLGHQVGGDVAACAVAVLHDHLLAEASAQIPGDDARHRVGPAAGGESHHHGNGARRECALRQCLTRL